VKLSGIIEFTNSRLTSWNCAALYVNADEATLCMRLNKTPSSIAPAVYTLQFTRALATYLRWRAGLEGSET